MLLASHFVGFDHVENLARRRPDDFDDRGIARPIASPMIDR
jgi:hypothetical protein